MPLSGSQHFCFFTRDALQRMSDRPGVWLLRLTPLQNFHWDVSEPTFSQLPPASGLPGVAGVRDVRSRVGMHAEVRWYDAALVGEVVALKRLATVAGSCLNTAWEWTLKPRFEFQRFLSAKFD